MIKIRGKKFKRSVTNAGDLCKQYFIVIDEEGKDSALAIRKFVLTDSSNAELYDRTGSRLIKCFKGRYLWFQSFSIKINTLNDAIDWMDNLKL